MDWKIGEIRQVNGEWYQCVEQPKKWEKTVCDLCVFHGIDNCELDKCSGTYRNDKKSVIFKKLEKVGEPYFNGQYGEVLQEYKYYIPPITPDLRIHIIKLGIVGIEIKQTKEDMEEKNNAKHSNSEKIGKNLKEFDLQKAREGKPVCTRDGRKARIICFDRKLFYRKVSYPILALVERSDGEDDVCGYNEKGKVLIEDGAEYKDDLMMLPEKKEGWVKIRKDINLYDTKEEADRKMIGNDEYVTAKVFWEE